MIEIDLTRFELFKSFCEIESHGFYIDLHNEFKCDSINFQNQKRELILSFKLAYNVANKIRRVDIVFEDAIIESFIFKDNQESAEEWTIDNIYRGRFEIGKETLSEISDDGRYCYYIDFYPSYSFELFAKI